MPMETRRELVEPVAVPVKADEVPAIAPTDLPLVLMATMVGEDTARSRATLRERRRR